ncbi:MAG TPA: trypsin-like peptidase domain-containing protein [Opitutaceae bacterium]
MHLRPILRTLSFIAALAVAACPAYAASAKDKKKGATPPPAAAGKKPAVVVDPTPVGQGTRPGLVMSYADVLEPAQKAVVSVYSTKIIKERVQVHPFFRQYFGIPEERESRQEGLGSGVIVTADGYILTNNHVVEGADELKVTLADDRDFIARVVGTDPKTDVAVLKIDGEKLPSVTLADSDKLRVGDVVFAVGNPLGVGQTVTMGIVSAKGRSNLRLLENVSGYEDFIQTDAAINMGNSGGALIDARGRLVGINSAIISPSRGNIGIGFAIPINLAAFIMNSLAETGGVARGYLGVDADTITPEVAQQLGLPRDTRGVVITDIGAKTPPELKTTDVILAINDHPVHSREELRLLVAQMVPDTIVRLSVVRDGQPRTLEVKLGQVVENELLEGVSVEPLSAEHRRRLRLNDPRINGLLITEVAEDSPAAGRLRKDMLILEVNRAPVRDLRGAQQALTPERNLFTIYERGQIRGIVVIVR